MSIKDNYLSVREKIDKAAVSSGRNPSDVKLVAVSKFKPVEDILEARDAGSFDFGENYIQEFTEKYAKISDDRILWHIIGPVQRNKVKYIADKKVLIQSVDRLELAAEISKQAQKYGKVAEALIQVNACMEETKSGCTKEEVLPLLEAIKALPAIRIRGLMTIGPNTDDMYEVEKTFAETYGLFEQMKTVSDAANDISFLSMGMTNDFELAIKHGANIVRVGRAIFGERYTKQ